MDYAITVKSQYVAAIRSREKCCEIRTRVPRCLKQGDTIYVIEAGTGGDVMLRLRVTAVWCDKPDIVFRIYGHDAAISRADYDAYVAKREVVYVIDFFIEDEGWPLMTLADLGLKKAPQWFTKVSWGNIKGGIDGDKGSNSM